MHQTARSLQLKDFRLIEAIHETGQLALAAEQLSMSQPAASRMLAGIERSVGGAVFERHPKGMTPTQVGLTLIRNGSNLLNGLEQTLKEIRSLSEGLAGTARVGSVTDGAVAFVVPAIQQLKQQMNASRHFETLLQPDGGNGNLRKNRALVKYRGYSDLKKNKDTEKNQLELKILKNMKDIYRRHYLTDDR